MEQEKKEVTAVKEEKKKEDRNAVESIMDIVKKVLEYNSLGYGAKKDVLK